jgi:predicted outer membrane repeat protein
MLTRFALDRSGLACLAGISGAMALTMAAGAAVIQVTTNADVINAQDGQTSLREALIAARQTREADRIVLSPGTYRIEIVGAGEDACRTGDFDIDRGDLTIVGSGAGVSVIDAAGNDRIFDVRGGSQLTLTGVTLRQGFADQGAAINLFGASGVTLKSCEVVNNYASGDGGAIHSRGGIVVVTGETVIAENFSGGRGGAIYARGQVDVLSGSTITMNDSLGEGGAIASLRGPVTIEASTLRANRAEGDGGGVWLDTSSRPSRVVRGALIVENQSVGSGAGVFIRRGSLAISEGGRVAGNSAVGDGGGIMSVEGVVTVDGGAIVGNAGGLGGGVYNGGSLWVRNEAMIDGNTGEFDGGGIYSPVDTSTALGAGVSVSDNTSFGGAGGITNLGKLRADEGVSLAGNAGGALYNGGTATLAGVQGRQILLGASTSGNGGGGIINFPGATLTATHVNFDGNAGADSGGAIVNHGVATISNCRFANNSSGDSTGGVLNESTYDELGEVIVARVTIANCEFRANASSDSGGGIGNEGGLVIVTGSTFSEMVTGDSGGVISNVPLDDVPGVLEMSACVIADNAAGDNGAGIVNESIAIITDVQFLRNIAGGNGGAVVCEDGEMTLTNVEFADNQAMSGGAIAVEGGVVTIRNATIRNNSVIEAGGGVLVSGGVVVIEDSVVRDNTFGLSGGGISNSGGDLTLRNVQVSFNTSGEDGGGVVNSGGGVLSVIGSIIERNSASRSGGGLVNSDATATLSSTTRIRLNTAGEIGGGIYNSGNATLRRNGAVVANNTPSNVVNDGGQVLP